MRFDVRPRIKPFLDGLQDFQRDQIPFATALALTNLAKGVQAIGTEDILTTFDRPTPFTQRAFGMKGATKTNLAARVFMKDAQANYLTPFEVGGAHYLGDKRGLLVPKNINLNQYGNLAAGKMQALKGRPDVFIGAVRSKNGEMIRGVWQRLSVAQAKRAVRAGKRAAPVDGSPARAGLKLLIRFEDPLPVKQHLDFQQKAAAYLDGSAAAAWSDAFARALATARRP